MRWPLLALAPWLLACGEVTTPTGSPATVSTSPVITPSAAASCRLPLANVITGSDYNRHGSWLELPSGTVVQDPTAEFTFDNQANLYRSQAQPVLVGNDGNLSYSRATRRWLPAAERAVSPDGLRYVYVEGWVGGKPERLHLVDATTGKETVSPLPQTPFAVIGFETDAIYLTFGWEALKGLWRFDVATGNVTKLSDAPNIWQGNSEKYWAGTVNPSDQEALPGMGGDQPDQLDEVNVKTGERKAWIYRPASTVYWRALDGKGRPIVAVTAGKQSQQGIGPGDTSDMLLLDSPLTAQVVFTGRSEDVYSLRTSSDGRRLWFGGPSGVFELEEDAGPLRKLSDQAGWPAGTCA